MEDLDELIAMADMFASTCTGQEEKYTGFQREGYTWRWDDCKAAFDLVRELPEWWKLVDAWRKENICKQCRFPKKHHAWGCSRNERQFNFG